MKDERTAYQAGLISRGMGLFLFSILIAHRWSMSEIAKFESFSILQYILFFSWLPAWGIVTLQEGNKGSKSEQKSFLFSNAVVCLLVVISLFGVILIWRASLIPWLVFSFYEVACILVILAGYFIMQMQVYYCYIFKEVKKQWVYAILQVGLWLLVALATKEFAAFIQWMAIISGLYILMYLKHFVQAGWKFDRLFWSRVVTYGIYLAAGAGTVIFTAYYVQTYFGLGDQFNWYRYGTRELPFLPALLAGFAQSFLLFPSGDASDFPYENLRKGLAFQMYLIVLPICILMVFSSPIFTLIYGAHFEHAGTMMSVFLLIYIPRILPTPMLMQALKLKGVLLRIGMLELCLVVLSLPVLVPRYGLVSVAWILVLGTLLERAMQMYYLHTRHGIKPALYLPLRAFAVWTIFLISACVLHYLL